MTTSDAAAPATALIGDSPDEFGAITDAHRRELLVHCYRMLGSIDDAEDALQETYVRAWRGRATFQRAGSVRAWLYRIATNACLDAIAERRGTRAGDRIDIGPIPDDILDDAAAGPEARFDAHESISLAFLTALQLLPARQRAVLILRDVLAWRADEVAALLELSVPAVNSALHRARTTLARRYRATSHAVPRRPAAGRLRALLEHYVRAWEAGDVAGLVKLLRDDAVVSMPPGILLAGAAEIRAFLAASVFGHGLRSRLLPIAVNRGVGYVVYSGATADAVLRPYAVMVVGVDGPRIGRLDVFADLALIGRFGGPAEIAG